MMIEALRDVLGGKARRGAGSLDIERGLSLFLVTREAAPFQRR